MQWVQSLPPAHEEVKNNEDQHDEPDEVIHVFRATWGEHVAEFGDGVGEQVGRSSKAIPLSRFKPSSKRSMSPTIPSSSRFWLFTSWLISSPSWWRIQPGTSSYIGVLTSFKRDTFSPSSAHFASMRCVNTSWLLYVGWIPLSASIKFLFVSSTLCSFEPRPHEEDPRWVILLFTCPRW